MVTTEEEKKKNEPARAQYFTPGAYKAREKRTGTEEFPLAEGPWGPDDVKRAFEGFEFMQQWKARGEENKFSTKDIKDVADIFAGLLGPKADKPTGPTTPSATKTETPSTTGALLGGKASAGPTDMETTIETITSFFANMDNEGEALIGAGGQYGPPQGQEPKTFERSQTIDQLREQGMFKKMVDSGLSEMGAGNNNHAKLTSRESMFGEALDERWNAINDSEENQSAGMWEGIGQAVMALGATVGIPGLLIAGMGMHSHGAKKRERIWRPFEVETDAAMKKLYGDDDDNDPNKAYQLMMMERERRERERQVDVASKGLAGEMVANSSKGSKGELGKFLERDYKETSGKDITATAQKIKDEAVPGGELAALQEMVDALYTLGGIEALEDTVREYYGKYLDAKIKKGEAKTIEGKRKLKQRKEWASQSILNPQYPPIKPEDISTVGEDGISSWDWLRYGGGAKDLPKYEHLKSKK